MLPISNLSTKDAFASGKTIPTEPRASKTSPNKNTTPSLQTATTQNDHRNFTDEFSQSKPLETSLSNVPVTALSHLTRRTMSNAQKKNQKTNKDSSPLNIAKTTDLSENISMPPSVRTLPLSSSDVFQLTPVSTQRGVATIPITGKPTLAQKKRRLLEANHSQRAHYSDNIFLSSIPPLSLHSSVSDLVASIWQGKDKELAHYIYLVHDRIRNICLDSDLDSIDYVHYHLDGIGMVEDANGRTLLEHAFDTGDWQIIRLIGKEGCLRWAVEIFSKVSGYPSDLGRSGIASKNSEKRNLIFRSGFKELFKRETIDPTFNKYIDRIIEAMEKQGRCDYLPLGAEVPNFFALWADVADENAACLIDILGCFAPFGDTVDWHASLTPNNNIQGNRLSFSAIDRNSLSFYETFCEKVHFWTPSVNLLNEIPIREDRSIEQKRKEVKRIVGAYWPDLTLEPVNPLKMGWRNFIITSLGGETKARQRSALSYNELAKLEDSMAYLWKCEAEQKKSYDSVHYWYSDDNPHYGWREWPYAMQKAFRNGHTSMCLQILQFFEKEKSGHRQQFRAKGLAYDAITEIIFEHANAKPKKVEELISITAWEIGKASLRLIQGQLHHTIKNDDADTIRFLLKRGLDLKSFDIIDNKERFEHSLLHDAIEQKNLEIFRLLLDGGLSVSATKKMKPEYYDSYVSARRLPLWLDKGDGIYLEMDTIMSKGDSCNVM